jgi:hypothetical protein
MIRKEVVTRVLLATTVVLAACSDGEPSAPAADSGDIAAAQLVVRYGTDPQILQTAIPSFGGMYIDEAGRPTVYVTDLRQSNRARRVLESFAEENGKSADDIVVLQSSFKYDDLEQHYNRSWHSAMEVEGAVFSDIDEAHNRLLFGVKNQGVAASVRARLRAAGVPEDAFAVEVVSPIENLATLRDVVRPTTGGLQIHFGNYLCTLGFNASFGGTASFITNSHCTGTQGGVENTAYYQSSSTLAPAVIAREVADPVYVKGGVCPRGKKCRYSDSSRANYVSGFTQYDLGAISSTNGSNLTITGVHNISSEADGSTSPVAVGATVSKTGRTTGTSTGQVTNTCVNTAVQGSQIMQLCQTFVAAAVGSGDSGSPAYTGSGNVTLVGILWGGSGNTFVFSPLRSIKNELGSFTAH